MFMPEHLQGLSIIIYFQHLFQLIVSLCSKIQLILWWDRWIQLISFIAWCAFHWFRPSNALATLGTKKSLDSVELSYHSRVKFKSSFRWSGFQFTPIVRLKAGFGTWLMKVIFRVGRFSLKNLRVKGLIETTDFWFVTVILWLIKVGI
jgi:hypothetical protein